MDIFLIYRHIHKGNNSKMLIKVPMPDLIVGRTTFEYFRFMGVQVKLVQETEHPLIEEILYEAWGNEGGTDGTTVGSS